MRLLRRLRRAERGQAVVEFALMVPVLLTLLLGVVELGNLLEKMHAMTILSREAANLAARGTELSRAVETTLASGASLQLGEHGGVVASRIVFDGKNPVIQEQIASSGYAARSLLGQTGQNARGLDRLGFKDDHVLYVVEVFYTYRPITALENIAELILAEELYERAVF